MDDTDRHLVALLRADARSSISSLARRLELSRSTVQDRMTRLEERGVIGGYTIRFKDEYANRQIKAHVLIMVQHKRNDAVVGRLKKMTALTALYAISGSFDLIAILSADTTEDIDRALDEIGRVPGIERTTSSIVLSTKFER